VCLGIPGEVVGPAGQDDLAVVAVEGVERLINVGLLADEGLAPGDWILVHLGFAFSRIDEATAKQSLDFVTGRDDAFAETTATSPRDAP
jgi:hydrogenase expression/formation protein HypC